MQNSEEWFFLSFNLAVFSLIVVRTLQGKKSVRMVYGFLMFFLLSLFIYFIASMVSASPMLFIGFKTVLFHAVGMIFLAGMGLYMSDSRFGKNILYYVISFYVFMFMFGKEVYSFILMDFASLALVQPDSPFLSVILVFLAIIAGLRGKILPVAGIMILSLLLFRSYRLQGFDDYIYRTILPSRLGPDIVIVEDQGGVYRKIHLSSGQEYYYRLEMKMLLNLGLPERQNAMRIVQYMEFPVIEENDHGVVLTDISVFRGNRFRIVEFTDSGMKMRGPLF